MWTCPKCGKQIEDQFDSCWHCETPRSGVQPEAPGIPAKGADATPAPVKYRAKYRTFRGTFATWEELFGDAAEFATEIGPNRLITISHSEDRREGIVAVWYWTEDNGDEPPAPQA